MDRQYSTPHYTSTYYYYNSNTGHHYHTAGNYYYNLHIYSQYCHNACQLDRQYSIGHCIAGMVRNTISKCPGDLLWILQYFYHSTCRSFSTVCRLKDWLISRAVGRISSWCRWGTRRGRECIGNWLC